MWNSSKKVIQIRQAQHSLQLTWVINNICTNHCSYCPSDLNSGSNHHYDWGHTKTFIERLIKRYPKIHVSISGGEPTLSPFLPELIELFYNSGHTVGITSNGARSVRYIREISKYLSYLVFSWHPQYDDPKLLEKAVTAAENTHVAIRVMMDSRYWDKAQERYHKFCEIESIRVEPVRILAEMAGKHVGDDYSESQLQWFTENPGKNATIYEMKERNPYWRQAVIGSDFYYDDGTVDKWGDPNHLVSSQQTDFRGWACNIGLESLFIHYDGMVRKGNCFQGGDLFHINNHNDYELPTRAEICEQSICHCSTDIQITKTPLNLPATQQVSVPVYPPPTAIKKSTTKFQLEDI